MFCKKVFVLNLYLTISLTKKTNTMQTHSFFVENLKCNGCANTIRKEVTKFSSVQNVIVETDQSLIVIELDDNSEELDKIMKKLAKIGYPKMGTENNIVTAAKSYVSCAIGRMGV